MRLEEDERVFAYVRTLGRARAWVVLNFTAEEVEVPRSLDRPEPGSGERGLGVPLTGCELVLCNYPEASGFGSVSGPGTETIEDRGNLTLRGYEARVYVHSTQ